MSASEAASGREDPNPGGGAAFPPIDDLLPHRGAMVLLDRVVEHGSEHTACEVAIGDATLFRGIDGRVPAWVAIEYMAQCIGAHAGLHAQARGEPVRIGFLLGSRAMALHTEAFVPGQVLRVRAAHTWEGEAMSSFECEVRDAGTGALLARAALNVYQPRDPADLAARAGRP